MTYYRQPTLARAYEASGPCQPLAELGYGRNQAWRVVAALDAWSGRVLLAQHAHLGVPQLVDFYQHLAQAYGQAQTIYVVPDNWPVHYHPDVLAALEPQQRPVPASRPRHWPTQLTAKAHFLHLPIQLLWLPTYASWTNPVEKLWRKLRQESLHVHRWADDWTDMKQAVTTFLAQFAEGSRELLRYVGLSDPEKIYASAFIRAGLSP